MRMAKVKSRAGLVGRLKHNTREFLTPNVDSSRSVQNWTSGGTAEVMARYSQLLPGKVRSNAVHAVELVMTASPDFSGDWKQYLADCDKWACGLFGKENLLHVAHHLDETTPHTQIIFMPLKDGKLNAKHFIGGSRDRMTELQDDFYQKVGRPASLERGNPRRETKARHSHHTLAAKAAELDQREEKIKLREKDLSEFEKKHEEFIAEFKQVMGIKPSDVRKLKAIVDGWDQATPTGLEVIAKDIRRSGAATVGEHRKAREAQREKEQSRSSLSR